MCFRKESWASEVYHSCGHSVMLMEGKAERHLMCRESSRVGEQVDILIYGEITKKITQLVLPVSKGTTKN